MNYSVLMIYDLSSTENINRLENKYFATHVSMETFKRKQHTFANLAMNQSRCVKIVLKYIPARKQPEVTK